MTARAARRRADVPAPAPNAAPRVGGLYAITPEETDTAALAGKVAAALRGGAALVQYRSKSADRARRREQAAALLALCRAAGVPLIVNDDLALALEIGADGVHLGRGDGELRAARRALGRTRLLGASCYDRLELAREALAAGADHVAFGSIYASSTKPGAARAPLELLTRAQAELAAPIVAIGGIALHNAAAAIGAGASALAVVSALFDAADIAAAASAFCALFPANRLSSPRP